MLLKLDDAFGCLPLPLHVLVWEDRRRFRSANIICHLWTGEIPSHGIIEVTPTLSVTSPLFTLLVLAPSLSPLHLIMALCEMCGTFSVYRMSPRQREQIRERFGKRRIPEFGGWRPVYTHVGELTDLWRRPPLVTRADIARFAEETRGMRGAHQFRTAAQYVIEGAASPFEVQAALRFSLPVRQGGLGLKGVSLNTKIELSMRARELTDQHVCYADILIEGRHRDRNLIVECQSALIHDEHARALADTQRMAALQAMGYTVIPITYNQIADPWQFRQLMNHMLRVLGERPRALDEAFSKRMADLCRNLFIDWGTLGSC